MQAEIEKRKRERIRGSEILTGKLFCGECGKVYGPKVWHSNDPKYRKIVWQCNSKFRDKKYCKTPHVTEDEIKDAFVAALNKVLTIREEVIANLRNVQSSIGNTDQLEAETERLSEELNFISNNIQKIIEENAITAQDQDDYQRLYNEQLDRYKKAENELKAAQDAILMQKERNRRVSKFISEVEAMPETITEFRPEYWRPLVDRVTVYSKDKITFTFATGLEV